MPSNNISCYFKPRHRYGFIFQCQAGVTGLVDEASCRWEETVLMAWDVHNSPAGDQSRSWFGRTAARSSYSLSISFHHTLLPTLYQKCVDIIPSHLDPKIVPELPRCGSAFFFFFVVVRLFSFFLFYQDVTLTAWEHSCFDHRLLTKVLCAPFSCSSHSSQIPRSPAKNNDSAFHLFFFFSFWFKGRNIREAENFWSVLSKPCATNHNLLTRLYGTVEAETYLQLSFFLIIQAQTLNIFTVIGLRYST